MTAERSTPIWIWITGGIALLWNGLGVLAYFQQVMMTPEQFAALPEIQRNLILTQPFWVTAAFAIAVVGGFVAAISFLRRKRIAVRLFLLSLVAVIVQFSSYFIIDGYMEFVASQGWVMPVLIPLFAAAFLWIARQAEQNGHLT